MGTQVGRYALGVLLRLIKSGINMTLDVDAYDMMRLL